VWLQFSLSLVVKESFKVYKAVSEGIINLADAFFEMEAHDAGGRRSAHLLGWMLGHVSCSPQPAGGLGASAALQHRQAVSQRG
jgi:hypothetical protein